MRSGQIMLWVRMMEVGVPFLNKLKRWHSGPFQGWGQTNGPKMTMRCICVDLPQHDDRESRLIDSSKNPVTQHIS